MGIIIIAGPAASDPHIETEVKALRAKNSDVNLAISQRGYWLPFRCYFWCFQVG